uniref:Uncharacterized protein n=1 Tax=Anopheles farauti TaxID=69004 RepID=A0A182Q4F2_9DIPT
MPSCEHSSFPSTISSSLVSLRAYPLWWTPPPPPPPPPPSCSCILKPMSDSSLAAATAANAAVLLIARTGVLLLLLVVVGVEAAVMDRAPAAAAAVEIVGSQTTHRNRRRRLRRQPLQQQPPPPLQPPPQPLGDGGDGVDGGCVDGDGAAGRVVSRRRLTRAESMRTAGAAQHQPPLGCDGAGAADVAPDAARRDAGVAVATPTRPSHRRTDGRMWRRHQLLSRRLVMVMVQRMVPHGEGMPVRQMLQPLERELHRTLLVLLLGRRCEREAPLGFAESQQERVRTVLLTVRHGGSVGGHRRDGSLRQVFPLCVDKLSAVCGGSGFDCGGCVLGNVGAVFGRWKEKPATATHAHRKHTLGAERRSDATVSSPRDRPVGPAPKGRTAPIISRTLHFKMENASARCTTRPIRAFRSGLLLPGLAAPNRHYHPGTLRPLCNPPGTPGPFHRHHYLLFHKAI